MTDFERTLEFFNSLGIPVHQRTTEIPKLKKSADTCLKIREGVGYADFVCEFYFDADGKFIEHGVWE